MNTNTMRPEIDWSAGYTKKRLAAAPSLHRAKHLVFRLLLAALPALALVVGSAWFVSAFEQPYVLQAAVWAAGFVFLALAMESRKPNVGALLATGLTLPALALLSARFAPEFAVLAVALVAAWIVAIVLKRHWAGNS
jgi:hypothetical protein